MRTLNHENILTIAVLLIFMLAVAFLNIFILARYKHSKPMVIFHVASIFLQAGLFSLLMEQTILELPLEKTFNTISRAAFVLSFAIFAASAILSLISHKRRPDQHFPVTDLKSVFYTIDDLAIVTDYRGFIIDVNHRGLMARLHLNSDTLQEMLRALAIRAGCPAMEAIASRLTVLKDKARAEFLLDGGVWLDLSILPISRGAECLGYTLFLQDISIIKNAEAQLKAQNGELEETNRCLARDANLAGTLEAEKQRLQILEKIQTDLVREIESAVTEVNGMKYAYAETGRIVRGDVALLAERLRAIYKDVRKSINVISGRKENI